MASKLACLLEIPLPISAVLASPARSQDQRILRRLERIDGE
jgi:hypothetical protein